MTLPTVLAQNCNRSYLLKTLLAKAFAVSALISSPVMAHSDQTSVMGGIIHFLTEPDHLAVLGLVVAIAVFAGVKVISKRS